MSLLTTLQGWFSRMPFGRVPEIDPQTLASWIQEKKPIQLVDARTALEYRQGTIGRARHAPLSEMPASLVRLKLDPHKPVVMLCLSGHRSMPGTRWLRAQGYDAYSLKGGVMAWRLARHPVKPPA
jgi:rhodanese-related sulfurtransferase